MSELERPSETSPAATQQPVPPEPWPPLWSWIVRILGTAIMVQQAWFEQQDRKWLLLCAMALMLGELGVKSLFRFLLRDAGGQS